MKNYEKPMVLANEELAEGVYTYSGAEHCYTYDSQTNDYQTDYTRKYNVRFNHTSDSHLGTIHTMVFTLASTNTITDVAAADSNCYNVTHSGNTVTCTLAQGTNTSHGYAQACVGINITFSIPTYKSEGPIVTGGYGYATAV